MSLTTSLSSALSGLSAAARGADVISSNVANSMTDGYGRREVVLSAKVVGGAGQGVVVRTITRQSDPVLLGDRRIAQAGSSSTDTTAAFMKQLEASLGNSDSATSLSGRVSNFDTALREAASRPDSEARLTNVLSAATALASQISSVGASIQTARSQADTQIGDQVDLLNTSLARISKLNGDIRSGLASGRDVSGYLDQRQQAIDGISSVLPLREVQRDNGGVALFTTGGAVILDGTPAEFSFTTVGLAVAGQTQAGGGLSGLTLNGRAVKTSGDSSLIAGGTLAAAFAVRDELGPEAQANIDAVARDLIERFSDPSLDPSLASGAAGLFTDAGGTFDPLNEVGIAQRIKVNTAADPASGGALWRLRDGLGAAASGSVGNASLLNSLSGALDASRSPASGGFSSAARSFASLTSDMTSYAATGRVTAENEATYSAAKLETLSALEREAGVDTDQEMQSLLIIEKAYSANAKVFSVVNDLLQTILEI